MVPWHSLTITDSPPVKSLLHIVRKMAYYVSDPQGHEAIQAHREYCAKVDNQAKFKNNLDWGLIDNQRGYRKHLATSRNDRKPVARRLRGIRDDLVPKLRAVLEAVPELQRNLPLATPFVEIGYTHRPYHRQKEHGSHVGTTAALALLEEIAALEFPELKYEWRFVVVAECRYDADRYFMESFFSRICQSYFWLGGFNGTVAAFATALGEEDLDTTTNAKQISTAQTDQRLSAMDFDQVRANIAADEAKLEKMLKYYDIKNRNTLAAAKIPLLEQEIEGLQSRLADAKAKVADLEKVVKAHWIRRLEAASAECTRQLEKIDELERMAELLDLTEEYIEAVRAEAAERDMM